MSGFKELTSEELEFFSNEIERAIDEPGTYGEPLARNGATKLLESYIAMRIDRDQHRAQSQSRLELIEQIMRERFGKGC